MPPNTARGQCESPLGRVESVASVTIDWLVQTYLNWKMRRPPCHPLAERMSTAAANKVKRPLRVFRFRLSTLLIALTAFGVWLGIQVNGVNRQKRAVSAIRAAKGIVTCDFERDASGKSVANATPRGPAWLRKIIGDDYFCNVVTVDFATGYYGRRKDLGLSKVNDAGLLHLESLPRITVLELGNNRAITDEGLVHLRKLKKLETLYLYRSSVTGSGLRHIADLPNLTALQLNWAPLTDDGLEEIQHMKNLKALVLEDTQITDDGLAFLQGLSKLEHLQLHNTKITDRGLEHLQALSNLKQLSLHGTKVTAEGVRRIEGVLPNCSVSYSFTLGKVADESPLFPADYKPSAAEIAAEFKSRGIDGHIRTDSTKPGSPIVSLYLEGTTLSDEVILNLIKDMPQLERLTLRRALAGNRLLDGLKTVDGLDYLELSQTNITNEGLQHLSQLNNLRELVLNGTAITNEALQYLRPLGTLDELNLHSTRVTGDAVGALRRDLPSCNISY